MSISPYPNTAYQVGWISALPIELAAARAMLDEEHGNPQSNQPRQDSNFYVLGRLHTLNVVIACLPRGEIGASSAALCARDLLGTFPNVCIGLMVGIGAGIPRWNGDEMDGQDCGIDKDDEGGNDEHGSEVVEGDVRLGDVIISSDTRTGGVVAYNFGRRLADGSFEVAYHLDRPPGVLRAALTALEATHECRENRLTEYMNQMISKLPPNMRDKWRHPGQSNDILFRADYSHQSGKTCKTCDRRYAIKRTPNMRPDDVPVIHYGIIATGSEVVKHAPTRNEIRDRHKAICLEMEAAGLMNNFPCVVIRGISDYADSHKNDKWQRYAAASAAACAKELLLFVPPRNVQESTENTKDAEIIRRLESVERRLELLDLNARAFLWNSSCGTDCRCPIHTTTSPRPLITIASESAPGLLTDKSFEESRLEVAEASGGKE